MLVRLTISTRVYEVRVFLLAFVVDGEGGCLAGSTFVGNDIFERPLMSSPRGYEERRLLNLLEIPNVLVASGRCR